MTKIPLEEKITVIELNDPMYLSLFNLGDTIEPICYIILFCIIISWIVIVNLYCICSVQQHHYNSSFMCVRMSYILVIIKNNIMDRLFRRNGEQLLLEPCFQYRILQKIECTIIGFQALGLRQSSRRVLAMEDCKRQFQRQRGDGCILLTPHYHFTCIFL